VTQLPLSTDAQFELNHCNKCGFCLPACPTYAATGSEMHSPRGRLTLMEAAWRGEIGADEASGLVSALSACLGCRACETACPSGVRYGRVLEEVRDVLYRTSRRYTVKTPVVTLMLQAVRHRRALRGLVGMGRWGRRLPLPGGLKAAAQLLPPSSRGPYVPRPTVSPPAAAQPILFFGSCVMEAVYRDTNTHSRELLTAAGAAIMPPRPEACCGALHLHTGNREVARQLARENLKAWRGLPDGAWIVSHAGGCGAMLKEYGDLLADDPVWGEEARQRAGQVRDFAWALAHLPRQPVLQGHGQRVGLQNSCHLVNVMGLGEWPEHVLRGVQGDTFVRLPSQDRCCGSAGVYNLNEPRLADKILEPHLDEIATHQIGRWVVNNPGCALQCQHGVGVAGLPSQVTQLADYLYECWTGEVRLAPGQPGT
jgi:glycolate oxidase iron-sulfur subunit